MIDNPVSNLTLVKREKEMVPDTIFTLRKMLAAIQQCEYTEGCIYKELQDIKRQFSFDEEVSGDGGFYGSMLEESNERAKKLFLFRTRVEGLLERLSLFLRIKDSETNVSD